MTKRDGSPTAEFGGVVFTEALPEPDKPPYFFSINDATIDALRALQIIGGEVPEGSVKVVGGNMMALHESLAADFPGGEVEVIPLQPVRFGQVLSLRSLHRRLSGGDIAATERNVFWRLLAQYSAEELDRRYAPGVPRFTLGEQAVAVLRNEDGSGHGSRLLHFAGHSARDQGRLTRDAQRESRADTRSTREISLSLAEELVLAALAEAQGKLHPHRDGAISRKVQLPARKTRDGVDYIPGVYSEERVTLEEGIQVVASDLMVGGTEVGAFGHIGVTRGLVAKKRRPQK